MRALKPHGYNFYLYAPKADPHLRRAWRDPHTPEQTTAITDTRSDTPAPPENRATDFHGLHGSKKKI